ncbi:Aldo/keto reductase [Dendrothele bispora CBS 962.96]|uniref:Aldo/keto reductase n=1 Tax=Dendrothele bispora (strain CBS 962.96) TaxID=1314807 RepID=A0A4S8MH69_DENBC|nr:Aldo/keto reductase [Dendrothele bispora CBS 962.96]
MSLPPRKIGNASVNPIGFGAMGISAFYGSVESDEERFKVHAAYAKCCTHWDSSNVYSDSEVLIGKWFKRTGKRNEIFLTSKFGYTTSGARGEPEYVREQCLKSLEWFGVDYIDLYYQHRVDSKVPIEITVGTMAELVKEGKVKYLGLSVYCRGHASCTCRSPYLRNSSRIFSSGTRYRRRKTSDSQDC